VRRALIIAAAVIALVYAADFAQFHLRTTGKNSGPAFGTVKMQPYYVIPHKGGKAEYIFGDPQDQTCIHALFPHSGYTPCWYLARQSAKAIPMAILARLQTPE